MTEYVTILEEVALAAVTLWAVVALLGRLARAWGQGDRSRRRIRVATAALAVPATLALGVSAYTSYLYFGVRLGITGWERAPMCGTAEAAILALSVYAWATSRRGIALIAYALVLVQSIPAFSLSGGTGGVVRIALGPVLLAVVLHLALGLEVRLRGTRRETLWGRVAAEARERIVSYLGIGRRGEDSAAIARSRAADRAVRLTGRMAAAKTGTRRYRLHAARLAEAIDAARRGLDPEAADAAEAAIVGRIIRRRSVTDLATLTDRHVWTERVPARHTSVTRVPVPGTELPVPGAELPTAGPEQEQVRVPARLEHATPGAEHAPVPAGTTTEQAEPAPPVRRNTGRNTRNTGGTRNTSRPARNRPALEVVRNTSGTRAEHIRALVASGVTEVGTIRNTLAEHGIPVPSDRYIRRVVSEARNTDAPAVGTNGYM